MAIGHPLLDVIRQTVLPSVRDGHSRVLPDGGRSGTVADPFAEFIEAYPYSTHHHTYFEWMWLLSGSAHMKIEGRIYHLQPGDFVILPPQMPHADVYSRSTPAYDSLWFSFRPDVVGAHLFKYHPVGQWEAIAYLRAPAAPMLPSLLLSLQEELEFLSPHATEAQQALLLQLVVWLLRILEPACRDATADVLPGHASQRALAYLHEHYAENVSLSDVARAAYLSPNYLAAVFKQETGKTVFDVLTEIRLSHARRLLLEDRLPVQEIAAAVGYSSPHHFSRLFRRSEGIPPSRYGKH